MVIEYFLSFLQPLSGLSWLSPHDITIIYEDFNLFISATVAGYFIESVLMTNS